MQININSWHYRFNAFVQRDKFEDRALTGRFTTCSYIRTCLYSPLKGLWNVVVTAIIGALLAWIVGSALIVPIVVLFFGATPGEIFVAPCVMVWMIVTAGLAVVFFKQMRERLKKSFKPNKEPNVFFQAIKDHHNKFCTRVEIV